MDRRTGLEIAFGGFIAGTVLIVALGCLLFPELFWDRFIWRYYWGPIVADAGGDAGDITSSYNLFDTLTYGLILAASAYYIHRSFHKLNLRIGTGFFLAMSPIIVIGPAARVLEDMELFREPLQYLFISPLIYIFLGLSTLCTVLLAWSMEHKGRRGEVASEIFLFTPGLIVSLTVSAFPSLFSGTVPVYPFLLITLLVVGLKHLIRDNRYETTVGLFWLQVLLFVGYLYLLWTLKGDWYEGYAASRGGVEPDLQLLGGAGAIGLVLISTLMVTASLRAAGKWKEGFRRLINPVNLMIIGGHMTDASATFIGIDFHHYTEKHVVPSWFIENLSSMGFPYPGLIMYPLKLIFLIPALYLIDISMEKGSDESPYLVALVKLTILVLGVAPGVRDLIRISLGV
ncbi:MAG: DUF63 family protein [Candidatus Thermoplasmatota archaeon]|nr:DUF63 family protein [Candidatus Thermoplasmatota archaeon]